MQVVDRCTGGHHDKVRTLSNLERPAAATSRTVYDQQLVFRSRGECLPGAAEPPHRQEWICLRVLDPCLLPTHGTGLLRIKIGQENFDPARRDHSSYRPSKRGFAHAAFLGDEANYDGHSRTLSFWVAPSTGGTRTEPKT